MTRDEIILRLQEMLRMAQELATLREPALEGDIQIILAVLADKLRYLDPLGIYPQQVDFE
jgi:hypothetical protein